MKKQFSTEELVSRWEDRRAILNLMGIFSSHYLLKKEKDIVGSLWAEAADVCLATNDGYYCGQEAVAGYFEALHQKNLLTSRLIQAKYPKELGDKTPEEVYGVGIIDYKPLDTPVLELSRDGKTAKGLWYCRNSFNSLTEAGPMAYYSWGWVAADFLRENGAWKIWHLWMVDDIHVEAGNQYYEQKKERPVVPEFAEMQNFSMPAPTVQKKVRELYYTDRPHTPGPRLPEPYDTFAETFSYGYEEEA